MMKNRRNNYPSIFSANMLFLLSLLLAQVFFTLFYAIPGVDELRGNTFFSYMTLLFNEAVFILGAGVCYLAFTRRKFWTVTRLNKGINIFQILIIVVLYILTLNFLGAANGFWHRFLEFIGYEARELGINQSNTIPELLLEILVVCVTPAICEEFLYRGIVMRAYEQRGMATAIIMSALLFGLMHSTLEQLGYTIIAGAVIGAIVYVTDSLWAGILFHFINNFVSTIVQFAMTKGLIPSQGAETTGIMNSDAVGILNMVMYSAMIVAVVYCLHLVSRRREKTKLQPARLRSIWLAAVPLVLGILYVLTAYFMAYIRGILG